MNKSIKDRTPGRKLFGLAAAVLGMFTVVLLGSIILIGNENEVRKVIGLIVQLGCSWSFLCAAVLTRLERSSWSTRRWLAISGSVSALITVTIALVLALVAGSSPPFHNLAGYAILAAVAFAIGVIGGVYYRLAVTHEQPLTN